jgi:antirestriction protein ArdC/phage/plasmid primase-like uncharacterized protein/predicted ABC-type ATPase/proteasome lid subunit RPN8/RPN11/predicted RNA methylase
VRDGSPQLWVVAGPNGAGKSTVVQRYADILSRHSVPVINPDDIAREMDPDYPARAALSARKEALRRQEELLSRGRSFLVETTLSGKREVEFMRQAAASGYKVNLVYVGVESPDVSTFRVGGHNVPKADIQRRYSRSLANLDEAVKSADRVYVLDNSKRSRRLVLSIEQGQRKHVSKNMPPWCKKVLMELSPEEQSYVEESRRQRIQIERQGQQNAFSGANMPGGEPATGRRSPGALHRVPERVPFTTIGKAFQDIERQPVQIIGQQVKSFADVADLAQGWRNPNYEELRYIYVKNGVVVDHEGVTCRLPGSTSCYTGNFDDYMEHLKDRTKALDADQIYTLHNHPTGDPKPSAADVEVTRYLCKVIPEIVGHVVINSGKYSIIGPDGQFEILPLTNLPDGWKDPILQPSKPHEALNDQLNSAQKIAGWAKALTKDRGLPVLIYLGAGLQVRGLQEISVSALANVALMREKMPGKLLEFGSTDAALALPDPVPEELLDAVVGLVQEHHVFLDAVGNRPDGTYFSLRSGVESPARHYDFVGGKPKTRFLPQDIQERKSKYHSGPGPRQLNLFDNVTIKHKDTSISLEPRYALAQSLADKLDKDGEITNRFLTAEANRVFGGTQAEGVYSPKDAFDAMEVAVNLHIAKTENPAWNNTDAEWATNKARELTEKVGRLPTQSRRDEEMDEFQQFSTPPALSFVANWVANIMPKDVVLEPSAGTGDLAIWPKMAGARVVLNELSERRRELLSNLFPEARLFKENAEQLNNVLPADVSPTVIVMNPPFSASAGRIQGERDTMIGARHIEQALKRLQKGGRLVAVVGQGMAADRPAFAKWWKEIEAKYNVRANIGISGKEYAKYGTTFDNQIVVIDKTGTTTEPVLTGRVESVSDLPALLEGVKIERQELRERIRNERQRSLEEIENDDQRTKRGLDQPAVEKDSQEVRDSVRLDEQPGEPDPGPGSSGTESSGRGNPGQPTASGSKTQRQPGIGNGFDNEDRFGGGQDRDRAVGDLGSGSSGDTGRDSSVDEGARNVVIEATSSQASEFTESVFAQYVPQRLTIAGAKQHPGKLVQSAAMSAVEPPAPSYSPTLPQNVIKDSLLSLPQLEAVVYAGQAHSGHLPNGNRKGFFVGDGTGVGKGREISGIILDNMMQGRKKAVWISASAGLIEDAKRDFAGIGGDPGKIFSQGKTKPGGEILQKEGILFTTYATLASGQKQQANDQGQKAGKTRAAQIAEWLGKDFDGVIAFDEAHAMGNALPMKGKRGVKKPSQQAITGVNLQHELPDARVVYVSATGATEVSNLSYAHRLGLWGENTAFADVKSFIQDVSTGGIASMELISRDMKAMGLYLSRSLSYDGVSYERLEHTLSPLQEDIYNELAGAWQVVLNNVNKALEITDAGKDGDAKSAALSGFWGAHQRFFNQVITAMQTPSVIDDMREQLDAGNVAVIQLVNTNEAAQERLVADAVAKNAELEDLDFTPRQMLIDYVRNGFPVAAYEASQDADGKIIYVPVLDSEGNQVFDKDAIALRDSLIGTLEQVRVPENPLDSIINAFGADRVAEVTGRKRRFVQVRDEEGNLKVIEQKRGKNAAMADAASFQSDKKDILVFSEAGGTGYSFHADNTAQNQRKRIHYILQPGWRADKAVQGFGRTHRTNQAQEPHYVLPTTNLKAQKRFVSSIARRLDQLGALTRGQREATSQGLFTASDNLESEYAGTALRNLFRDLYADKTSLSFQDVTKQMGLSLIGPDGGFDESKIPSIPQFLNRLLSLTTDKQNDVFAEFEHRLVETVEYAKQRGMYDEGLQTIRAVSIRKTRDDIVFEEKNAGAKTRYVELAVTNNIEYEKWEDARLRSEKRRERGDLSGWFVSEFGKNKGEVFYLKDIGERLNAKGNPVRRGTIYPIRKNDHKYIDNVDEIDQGAYKDIDGRYQKVSLARRIREGEAGKLWKEQIANAPETITKTERMIVGVILPIWDRVEGSETIKRLQTDDGEQLLGRVLGLKASRQTLKNLGVGSDLSHMSAMEILAAIKSGAKAILSNGWEISTAKVNYEDRIEIKGRVPLTDGEMRLLKEQGAFMERISWQERVFIPTGEGGIAAFERITAAKPVVDLIEKNRGRSGEQIESEPEYGIPAMAEPSDLDERRDKVLLEPITRRKFDEASRLAVQEAVATAVENDPKQFIERYKALPQTFGGRYICSDAFKETFDEYNSSKETRNLYNLPVHNAAAVLASEQFRRVLAEPAAEDRKIVLLLTGAPGSGKTSTIINRSELPRGVHAVYEGQMANPQVAIAKVREVLEAGFKPEIVAIHGTPERVLENTLARFEKLGRGASINAIAKIQGGLPVGLRAVRECFGNTVALRILDRRDNFDEPKEIKGWENIHVLESEGTHEEIKEHLIKHLEGQSLSEDAYRQAAGLAPMARTYERGRSANGQSHGGSDRQHEGTVRERGTPENDRETPVLSGKSEEKAVPKYKVLAMDPRTGEEAELGEFDTAPDAYSAFITAGETTVARVLNDAGVVVASVEQGQSPVFGDPELEALHRESGIGQRGSPETATPYHQKVAEKIISLMERDLAPWQKPWKPGEMGLPHNPVSGTRYRGGNLILLAAEAIDRGYVDSRWLTYNQAQKIGAQVKKGEKGTRVEYYKFEEHRRLLDDKGQPVLADDGKPVMESRRLNRPKMFSAFVFNAVQIDGMPPPEERTVTWKANERAQSILDKSGAKIINDQGDRAFYRPSTDSIHLPDPSQFDSVEAYYAVALHELSHWTGEKSRLDRDLSHPFGTIGYAKEELRAEIASFMLGEEVRVGHDPENHASYVKSWINILQDDPQELFRASAAAEKIMDYVLDLEVEKEQEVKLMVEEREEVRERLHDDGVDPQAERSVLAQGDTFIAVPYMERMEAKALGAKWDKEAKSWYVPKGDDLTLFKRWSPNAPLPPQREDPVREFAVALAEAGLRLDSAPLMDGKLHRVPVEGDRATARSGAYRAFLDGRPAGMIQNWKTGLKTTWKSQGAVLSAEERANLLADAAQKRIDRQNELERLHEQKATECEARLSKMDEASAEHPYLVRKGVEAYGLYLNGYGDLIVPLKDAQGKLWSLQRIQESGEKPFEKDARKQGCFHTIGELREADEILIAEGYATAASVHQATGRAVVVALDSGNLLPVAKALHETYPGKHITILGDDDRHLPEREPPLPNAGREKAEEAAKEVEGSAIFPTFLESEIGAEFTDFNDLARSRGLDAINRQIELIFDLDMARKTEDQAVDRELERDDRKWERQWEEQEQEADMDVSL